MKTKGEDGLAWEPGCPVAFRAIQISRNVNTADAFLQAEARNVLGEEIGSFKARFDVSYEPVAMLRPKLLGLSDEAVAERSEEVWGSPEAVKYARRGLEEHDGWWLCPCGRLNVAATAAAHAVRRWISCRNRP